MTRTFHIRTFGCQMNEHDSERLAGLLIADGLEPTDDVEDADVVLLNTCCIRENADNKLYGYLGWLKSLRDRRPGMQIAVGGCLAQKDRDAVRRRAGHVDVVFGTHNLTRAPALLRQATTNGPVVEILDAPSPEDADALPLALSAVRELPYTAWVTIQSGCDNSCAFCIVPQVRGPEVSRPVDDIVAEVASLSSRGVTEVTLLGQNVNSYGRDLTRRHPLFAQLLRAVGAVDGVRRVRYTSPHPKDLRPETIAAMAETASVCEHLHLPLQSGSDRVLSAMRRGYRAERYLARLSAARAAIDDLAVTTDIIVGFPGETDDDFERTLEVVSRGLVRQRLHLHLLAPTGDQGGGDDGLLRARRRGGRAFRTPPGGGGTLRTGAPPCPHRPRRGGRRGGTQRPRPRSAHGTHPTEQTGALRASTRRDPRTRFVRGGARHRRRTAPPPGRAGVRDRPGAPAYPHSRLGTVGPVQPAP